MKDLKIKPCREMTSYTISQISVPLLLGELVAMLILVCIGEMELFKVFGFVALGIVVASVIIFICVRLAYSSKLVFSESGIAKCKNGEIVFEVKKEEITELCLKKYTAFDWFAGFLDDMSRLRVGYVKKGHGSILSIRYGKCEVITDRKGTFPNISTFTKDDISSNESEFCELISNRDFKKIIKKMELPFRYL